MILADETLHPLPNPILPVSKPVLPPRTLILEADGTALFELALQIQLPRRQLPSRCFERCPGSSKDETSRYGTLPLAASTRPKSS